MRSVLFYNQNVPYGTSGRSVKHCWWCHCSRASNGDKSIFKDAHRQDLILFHEYFDGESGAGLGATHQTGWTGLVARLIHMTSTLTKDILKAQNAERLSVRIK